MKKKQINWMAIIGWIYAIFLVCLRIIWRIFYPHLPKVLIYENNLNLAILCIFILSLHVFLLVKLFMNTKNPLVQKLFIYLNKCLHEAFEVVYLKYPRVEIILNRVAVYTPEMLYKKYSLYIFYIVEIFPRIFVPSIFFIEAIYFEKLDYFYKSIILFALPLVFGATLYMVAFWSAEHKAQVCQDLTLVEGPNIANDPNDFEFELIKDTSGLFMSLEEYFSALLMTDEIVKFYHSYQTFKSSKEYKFSLGFLHASYILGWLVIGINLFFINLMLIKLVIFQLVYFALWGILL